MKKQLFNSRSLEAKKINPLQHRLSLSRRDWLRTYFYSVFLLPIRFLLLLLIHTISYVILRIALFKLNEENLLNEPIDSSWRNFLKTVLAFLGRIIVRVCGISVTVKGQISPKENAPIFVIAPHTSHIDGFIAGFWCNAPSLVLLDLYTELPFYDKMSLFWQHIALDRNDDKSRRNAETEILMRTKNSKRNKGWPQIAIFPEGVCTNGKALMHFKPGAFKPGKSVQPVLLRFTNEIDTVTSDRSSPYLGILATICQPVTRVEIQYLPVYQPCFEEQEDAELFANNVRELMALELDLPLSEMKFAEAKRELELMRYWSKRRQYLQ